MLTVCVECGLQVSDKASFCPHCGYPMKENISVKHSKRRMRLPNGFGQISEIKNRNLRKPFRAMVTVGKTAEGRPICKILKPEGYFSTYNEAYTALVEYNKNPYDLSPSMTAEELFDEWYPKYCEKVKYPEAAKNAWRYCSSVYKMRVVDLRARHIKGCIDNGKTPSIKHTIKVVFNLMLDYALEYELVTMNYSRTFNLPKDVIDELNTTKSEHIPFTDDEIERLWQNISANHVNMVIICCYMGWRPRELCAIKKSDVNLEEGYIRAGMKTAAGTNRVVPIHSKIENIIRDAYNSSKTEYLFDNDGKPFNYERYKYHFYKIVRDLELNPDHKPHDCRKHFVTMAKKYNVDEYAIKRIVGHSITDITEKTYTQRDFAWLKAEMEKIK